LNTINKIDVTKITPISKKEATTATLDSLQKMLEVMFYFFEDEDKELEFEENLNDFLQQMWDISVIAMIAAGIKIIGKSEDGTYIATVTPLNDFKKWLCKHDYADESQTFFEDMCDLDDEALIGMHEKHLII
jgi:hypothetical protein